MEMRNKKVQQCKIYDANHVKYPAFGMVKMNGIFGRYDAATNSFFTRKDKPIRGLTHLTTALKGWCPDVDCELVIPGMEFFEMNGLIRREDEKPNCVAYIFDFPHDSLVTEERYDTYMTTFAPEGTPVFPHVHPLKAHLLKNKGEYDKFHLKVLKAGFEGTVIKSLGVKYFHDKKWHQQKRVPVKSIEGTIAGFEEGTGKRKGMLGKFVCTIDSADGGIVVKVGTGKGMTNEFLSEVWRHQEKYVGQCIKIEFKDYTPTGSLQSPKYAGIRWDI